MESGSSPIFSAEDFRDFVRQRIEKLKKPRGEMKAMAVAAGISLPVMSLILKRRRKFSPDQAYRVARYLGLDDAETKYALGLVQLSRATDRAYRRHLEEQLAMFRNERLTHRETRAHSSLSDTDRETYFSSWIHLAVHLLTSLPGAHTIDEMSQRLQVPREVLRPVIDSLVEARICSRFGDEIRVATLNVSTGKNTQLSIRHSLNWRIKALEHIHFAQESDAFFTSVVSISQADFEKVRELVGSLRRQVAEMISKTRPERLACMNLDWFVF